LNESSIINFDIIILLGAISKIISLKKPSLSVLIYSNLKPGVIENLSESLKIFSPKKERFNEPLINNMCEYKDLVEEFDTDYEGTWAKYADEKIKQMLN
jgi:hypothetical protein